MYDNPGRKVRVKNEYDNTIVSENIMDNIMLDNNYDIFQDQFVNFNTDKSNKVSFELNKNKLIVYCLDKILT